MKWPQTFLLPVTTDPRDEFGGSLFHRLRVCEYIDHKILSMPILIENQMIDIGVWENTLYDEVTNAESEISREP